MRLHLPTRRGLLAAGSTLAVSALMPRIASAATRDPRFVFVILRGALDGLAFLPALGDPAYASLRGALALPASGDGAALPLGGLFGLNPNLPFLKGLFDAREALMLHAVATPYRERSHFDGQDVLENGTPSPNGSATGWLNRAAGLLPAAGPARGRDLFACGATVPLVMRGPAPVMSWSPGDLRTPLDDTVMRLERLYGERDPRLLAALTESNRLDAMLPKGPAEGGPGRSYATLAAAAGRVLARPEGPRIATLALDGWDTHAAEGPASGRLAHLLKALDDALAALKAELGPAWGETVVAVATEFGRTAHPNGTDGTDHGTAAAAFLAGGAVAGGRVVADWPGLAPASLLDGRDLRPTLDLRAVLKGVLRDHLGLPDRALSDTVFPGSGGVGPTRDLLA
ncbi:hypothetical protein AFCDBAGC_4526 [Methylobacterium cerastii]|uniref:DUF1501 domain-containing protein n=1 Tax=Methylobacterium cerastii TaxID=932741 RepID=A0ABQ4QN02_9HYPH|nr:MULTISPECIES: DUF1501 domain-containing protein [Methylobacterium]TXN82414.1 DUF1501 domain-containing protein [Methylobacterium sp. WL8]GJD46643.1 hypothetical protein AFCDBAGC_4526 [Methylobacterium cerastii]